MNAVFGVEKATRENGIGRRKHFKSCTWLLGALGTVPPPDPLIGYNVHSAAAVFSLEFATALASTIVRGAWPWGSGPRLLRRLFQCRDAVAGGENAGMYAIVVTMRRPECRRHMLWADACTFF